MHARSFGLGGLAAVVLLLAGLTPAPAQDTVYGSAAAEIIQQAEGTTVQQGDQARVTSARVIMALPNMDRANEHPGHGEIAEQRRASGPPTLWINRYSE